MPALYADGGVFIRRIADGALIPDDPNHPARAKYLSDFAADPDCVVPESSLISRERALALGKARIDTVAEEVRLRYLTPGEGQAMTYLDKAAEAAEFIAGGAVGTEEEYPFLAVEANHRNMTMPQIAAEIMYTRNLWKGVGSAIEGLRMGGKKALDTLDTSEEIAEAVAQICSNIEAI